MPLHKSASPEAFKHNLKAEMKAGKPQKQSLAIAYSVKRKAQHKATGGEVEQHCPECMAMGGKCMAHGGKLSAEERHNLPSKDFALPGERYPIEDESHARNALARVSQHGSPEEKAQVRKKVHSKYPDIEMQHMAKGGEVNPELEDADEEVEMAPHELQDHVDSAEPMSLAQQIMRDRQPHPEAEEEDVDAEDGRESRGLNLAVEPEIEDDEHDVSDPNLAVDMDEDSQERNDSLVAQILRERRKNRRDD